MYVVVFLLCLIAAYYVTGVAFWLVWLYNSKPWNNTYGNNVTWKDVSFMMLRTFCRHWTDIVRKKSR